jgi:hypothetical protein
VAAVAIKNRKQESSFSVEKEAKRLSSTIGLACVGSGPNRIEVFWFFFQKRTFFLWPCSVGIMKS